MYKSTEQGIKFCITLFIVVPFIAFYLVLIWTVLHEYFHIL